MDDHSSAPALARRWLSRFTDSMPLSRDEGLAAYPLLVKAAAFRLCARIIGPRRGQAFAREGIERMATCVRSVVTQCARLGSG